MHCIVRSISFSHKGNADDASSSGVCMLADTIFHRQLKQGVSHVLLKGRIGNVRPPTCFLFWICLPIAKISMSAGSIAIHQSHANSEPILSKVSSTTDPRPSFSLRNASDLYFCIQFQMENMVSLA